MTAPAPDRRVITFVQRFGENAVRKELTLAKDARAGESSRNAR